MPANWQSFAFTLLTEPMTEQVELTQMVLAFKLMEFTQVALAFTLLTELTQVIAFTELMKLTQVLPHGPLLRLPGRWLPLSR